MKRTPKANIDERIFNNPINENIDEKKWLTSGIEVLKLKKTSSYIDIKNLDKLSHRRAQIYKGDHLLKKVQM